MTPILSIQNLTVQFDTPAGKLTAVDNVSLDIMHGETLGIVGESGCGKSVTAMSVLRLIPSPPGYFASGKILFNDVNLLTLPYDELRAIRGAKIGMVFQDPMTALSPLRTIGSQLIETLQLHRKISRKEALDIAVKWLEKVGISNARQRMREYPHQFSGGMQQRVMIASALMHHPQLIIADEPTTALDVTIQQQVLELMKTIKGDDASMLLITHDMGVIRKMCTRVIVMYAGEIVEIAPVNELFSNPKHPYTQALLAALPSSVPRGAPIPSIQGTVPSLIERPVGCRFAPRCPFVMEACRMAHPKLEKQGEGHLSRCIL